MLKDATFFSVESQALERIESLKAGLISGIGCAGVGLGLKISHHTSHLMPLLITGAIAAFSGFLFGVTYRYIIRTDANFQLKSGTLMAFSLVRSLAQVELQINQQISLEITSQFVCLAEGVLWFLVPQILLELCLSKNWLKTFGQK